MEAMYESHFGLRRRPFASVPCVAEFFPAQTLAETRATLTRCIQRAEGTGMVVGPSGSGKTLLCQLLAEHFQHELAVVLLSSAGVSTRRTLLQGILYELGRPYRGMDEGELRLALVDYLTADEDGPPAMLLLIDDAHSLPVRLLDEIRMLGGLVTDGKPRTRLVLAGSPLLEEQLASPKLESFAQRIVARCYLEPLGRAETAQYIQAQVAAAGGNGIFSPDACLAAYKATDGVPRLINQVCDHALLMAYAAGRRQIGAAGVEEAWADLQQLPAPSRGAQMPAGDPISVIEFGQLADEMEESPQVCGTIPPSGATALRVAPGSEGLCEEPVNRLEQIEQTLGDLDDDFQPAGSIEPEVELVFDACQDPFGESFAEETVVADRYLGSKRRPPMRSEPMISQALPVRALPPLARPTSSVQFGTLEDDPYQPAVPTTAPNVPSDTAAQSNVATKTFDAAELGQHLESGREQTWKNRPETVRLHSTPSQEVMPGEPDEDVIVVEDGYETVEPLHVRQVAVVRRQEYGQLFARLRRSC